jgi:hypothetical protein
MPFLNGKIDADGPVIFLYVNISSQRVAALRAAGQAIPASIRIRGLIDTGASCTAIDESAINSLGLVPTGSILVHTPSTGTTPQNCNQYDMSLWFVVAPGYHQISQTIPVIGADFSMQGIQALIGRDILANCLLVYNGQDGTFSLSF